MPNNVPDLSQNPSHYNPVVNTKNYAAVGLLMYVGAAFLIIYFLKRK